MDQNYCNLVGYAPLPMEVEGAQSVGLDGVQIRAIADEIVQMEAKYQGVAYDAETMARAIRNGVQKLLDDIAGNPYGLVHLSWAWLMFVGEEYDKARQELKAERKARV